MVPEYDSSPAWQFKSGASRWLLLFMLPRTTYTSFWEFPSTSAFAWVLGKFRSARSPVHSSLALEVGGAERHYYDDDCSGIGDSQPQKNCLSFV